MTRNLINILFCKVSTLYQVGTELRTPPVDSPSVILHQGVPLCPSRRHHGLSGLDGDPPVSLFTVRQHIYSSTVDPGSSLTVQQNYPLSLKTLSSTSSPKVCLFRLLVHHLEIGEPISSFRKVRVPYPLTFLVLSASKPARVTENRH